MKKQLTTAIVLKQDPKIGNRPVNSKFSDEKAKIEVWEKLGLVKEVKIEKPNPKAKTAPKKANGKKADSKK